MKENLLKALEVTWKGMLAIFIAMAIISLLVLLLNRVMKPKANGEKSVLELSNVDLIANISEILGYISLATGILIIGFIVGIPGIVLSCIGKKSSEYSDKAIKGFKYSLIGSIIGLFMFILAIVLINVLA